MCNSFCAILLGRSRRRYRAGNIRIHDGKGRRRQGGYEGERRNGRRARREPLQATQQKSRGINVPEADATKLSAGKALSRASSAYSVTRTRTLEQRGSRASIRALHSMSKHNSYRAILFEGFFAITAVTEYRCMRPRAYECCGYQQALGARTHPFVVAELNNSFR